MKYLNTISGREGILLILLPVILIMTSTILPGVGAESSKVERDTQSSLVLIGQNMTNDLDVFINDNCSFYAIEEYIPPSWTIVDNGSGGVGYSNYTLKYYYLNETVPANDSVHTYIVTAPMASGKYSFTGYYAIQNMSSNETIGGDRSVLVADFLRNESGVERVIENTDPGKGELVNISLTVVNNDNFTFFAIEEQVPPGCELVHNGSYTIHHTNTSRWNDTDANGLGDGNGGVNYSDHELKWIYYTNDTISPNITFTYTIRSPESGGDYDFTGIYMTENMTSDTPIKGDETIHIDVEKKDTDGPDDDRDGGGSSGGGGGAMPPPQTDETNTTNTSTVNESIIKEHNETHEQNETTNKTMSEEQKQYNESEEGKKEQVRTVDEDELKQGITISLEKDKEIRLRVGDKEYLLTVNDIDDGNVRISVSDGAGKKEYEFQQSGADEPLQVDLDKDGKPDLELQLDAVEQDIATFDLRSTEGGGLDGFLIFMLSLGGVIIIISVITVFITMRKSKPQSIEGNEQQESIPPQPQDQQSVTKTHLYEQQAAQEQQDPDTQYPHQDQETSAQSRQDESSHTDHPGDRPPL